jgi:hypothetical protein
MRKGDLKSVSDDDKRDSGEQQEDQEPQSEQSAAPEAEKEQEVPYMERFFGITMEEAGEMKADPSEEEGLELPAEESDEEVEAAESRAESDEMSEAELNETIENICRSKAQEFRMLGYEQVKGMDIWECVSDRYHKTGMPPLHRVVNDILSLKVTQFMNWMTISMYKNSK